MIRTPTMCFFYHGLLIAYCTCTCYDMYCKFFSKRYNSLDDEMDMIGSVWNSAKDQLKQQQEESRKVQNKQS